MVHQFAAVFSDDDEGKKGSYNLNITKALADKLPGDGTQEEEWHMDFMPTGYLPDSVYRELAWYGILQIQPLHHSSKYKVAAQLIWQHTLGRPHVIMENPPQIAVSKFLDECAIDNNIVITFEYFGDEPRKDVLRNATLCTTWDPCRLSYLYRLEPPPVGLMPAFPTTTSNPCESTVCPECLEENADDLGVEIPPPLAQLRVSGNAALATTPSGRCLESCGQRSGSGSDAEAERQRQRRGSGAGIADPFSKLAGGSRVTAY
ncbi:unnamed protein product [Spodoptera exigua]|nr:unnamed protein product [Spodoptera exigua]